MHYPVISVLIYSSEQAIYRNSVKIKEKTEVLEKWNFVNKYLIVKDY